MDRRVAGSQDGASTEDSTVTVVPVCGSAASGAPRLARMLGAAPGFFLVGDINKVWLRGARDNQSCGCGKAFHACPFWSEVGEAAFGGWSEVDLERVNRLVKRLHSTTGVVSVLAGRHEWAVAEYGHHLNRLLGAIRDLTGSRVMVSFAKNPYQAMILGRAAEARIRWVHVVRDPRDIAWLWMTGTVKMGGPLPISTAGIVYRWGRYNVIPPLLSRMERMDYLRVTFESLIREPERTLTRAVRFSGRAEDRHSAPTEDHGVIVLDREAGPCRLVEADFRNQYVSAASPLPETELWRQEMPPVAKAAVTSATFPMMHMFGYLGSRHTLPV